MALVTEQKVYVNDVGTLIKLDTGQTITDATVVQIRVKQPNGKKKRWTATVLETTKVGYITQLGDLPMPGTYLLQAYVDMPSWTGRGETVEMEVYDGFDE